MKELNIKIIALLLSMTLGLPVTGQAEKYEEGTGGETSFHGYGELHYNRPDDAPGGSDTEMDFHRLVIGLSHEFSEDISLHTELDFEHATTELELEFAYIDFRIRDEFNIRAGAVLMPVGYLNEFHEPPLFYSVERPYVQKFIIPTTWQEGGAGIFGTFSPGLKYRVYIVSGLDAAGFDSKNGIRGGRGKVAEQKSEDMAFTGRVEYAGIPGLQSGISFYQGETNQGSTNMGSASVQILEADLGGKIYGFELRGLYAQIDIDDADLISAAFGETIAEKMSGYYGEIAYRLSNIINFEKAGDVVLMTRYEKFDTQDEVPQGFTANKEADRKVLTYALAYYPIDNIAVKADYENWEDGADNSWNQFNLALAYMF